MFTSLRKYLRLDAIILTFSIFYLALFAPLIPRNTASPQLLAAYVNDEPFLVMALEAMLKRPFGNPANYFDDQQPSFTQLPARWGNLRYQNIIYYGGAMFEIAVIPYAALRAIGLPAFPTGPIVLRTLTLLASLLSLILLYNIAKERGSRTAGLLSITYMASDSNFIYYANYIHPDALQMFLALCAFVIATRHCKTGARSSVIALGIVCGLVQGTKVGGPWIIPMAVLATWLGARSVAARSMLPSTGSGGFTRTFVQNTAMLGSSALIGFFISTPYAFLNGYYARSLGTAYTAVTQDHLQQATTISLFTWGSALYAYVGSFAAIMVGLVFARTVYQLWRRATDPALLLSITLAISQFLWFGITGHLWLMIGYLILSFGLLSVFAFETVLKGVYTALTFAQAVLKIREASGRLVWSLVACACVILVAGNRWYGPINWVVEMYSQKRSTVIAVNDWAVRNNVNSDATIVFDDLAFFDPGRFPKARMHGGLLKWTDVDRIEPDYIVLSSSLYGADWVQNLRATQRRDTLDPNEYSVRLYQDLLSTDKLGPTNHPGVELIEVVRPQSVWLGEVIHSTVEQWTLMCSRTVFCSNSVYSFTTQLLLAGEIERKLRLLTTQADKPLDGPEIRIFKVNEPGSTNGRMGGFGTGTAAGYKAKNAFDGSTTAWACNYVGAEAQQCHIGYDFGIGNEKNIKSIRVQWVYRSSTPRTVDVEYSDENVNWALAARVNVEEYPSNIPNYRVDRFVLPDKGRHRFWRLTASNVDADMNFAVAELSFLEALE